jgi:hypothetical protein
VGCGGLPPLLHGGPPGLQGSGQPPRERGSKPTLHSRAKRYAEPRPDQPGAAFGLPERQDVAAEDSALAQAAQRLVDLLKRQAIMDGRAELTGPGQADGVL